MKAITTTLMCLTMLSPMVMAQQFKDTIKKELAFEQPSKNNVFVLSNISGSIDVEAYDGDKILLETERILMAKTDRRLEKAKEEIGIGVIDHLDTIIVFIKGPCGNMSGQKWLSTNQNKYQNQWNDCKYEYRFKLNFTLKVPRNQNLLLSTINDGDIEVRNVQGSLNVNNINGGIDLKGISGKIYAKTINGDLDLDYKRHPSEESYYYTLNGDINAYYPTGLKADMTFKSFNGDFYTNISKVEQRPKLMEERTSKKNGVSFKLNAKSVISVGGGGTLLAFETFNGNVYIKEKQ